MRAQKMITSAIIAGLIPCFAGCSLAGATVAPQGYCRVVRVIDGDTVSLRCGNSGIRKARLVGVDTPETKHPRKPVECFGHAATAFTTQLVEGKKVRVSTDTSQDQWDRYGRWLTYIWVGKTFLNKTLIKEGYAHEYTYHGMPYHYQQEFRAAQRYAQTHHKGLWNKKNCPVRPQ